MTLIAGWIGLLTALDPTGGAAVTEASGTGYARQPVRFGPVVSGVSKLGGAFTFGSAQVGTTVGRAIYSAPTGGTLLMVLPYANGARPQPGGGPVNTLDVGGITLTIGAMAAYPDGEAFTGYLTLSGAPNAIGTVYDATDEALAPWAQQLGPGGASWPKAIKTAPLMAPVAGQLQVRAGSIAWQNPQ